MKLSKGVKNQIVASVLGSLTGAFTVSAFRDVEDARASQIIADQKSQIKKLTADNKRLLAGNGGSDAGKETPVNDANNRCADQLKNCEGAAYFSDSVFCQFANDPLEVAKKRRDNCADANKLNSYIDQAIKRCDAAIAFEKAPLVSDDLKNAKTNLLDSKSHYRISPPQCAEIIQPKSND